MLIGWHIPTPKMITSKPPSLALPASNQSNRSMTKCIPFVPIFTLFSWLPDSKHPELWIGRARHQKLLARINIHRPYLAVVATYNLKAVLRVEVPDPDKLVLGAGHQLLTRIQEHKISHKWKMYKAVRDLSQHILIWEVENWICNSNKNSSPLYEV